MDPLEKLTNFPLSVAIQIPSYNNETFVKESIDSCLNQSYKNLKIGVFEDYSTDGTHQLLHNYNASNVEIIFNSSNLGRVLNYRNAWNWSKKSDWFINLDGDDFYTNNFWIEDYIKHITNTKYNISLVQTSFLKYVNIKDVKILEKLDENTFVISGYEYIYHTIKNYSFSHLSCIFNSKYAIETEAYSDDCMYCDLFTGLRIASCGQVIVSNKNVGEWRVHEFNNSIKKSEKEEKVKNEMAFYKFFEYLEHKFTFSEIKSLIKIYETREFNKEMSTLSLKGNTLKILKSCLEERNFSFISLKHILKSLLN